jgi:hypothetical protein
MINSGSLLKIISIVLSLLNKSTEKTLKKPLFIWTTALNVEKGVFI